MNDSTKHPQEAVSPHALTPEKYAKMYRQSVENNEDFWAEQARELDWSKKFSRVKNVSFDKKDLKIRWFEDGKLNVCVNCIDRHLLEKANKTAIIWEGDDPTQSKKVTYQALHDEVCRLANALESLGIGSGDRVILYMPMVLEATYAMLACARIGAIHSAVFGGFSANALADRIENCGAKAIITADFGSRGKKAIPLKNNVDEALKQENTASVEHVLVVRNENSDKQADWVEGRDLWYRDLVNQQMSEHEPKAYDAEHPLFILYTSGSTGKPKGLQHASGGYLTYALSTFRYGFGYQEDDIFWCGADIGWITGHTYIVYGPLAAGATTVMYEGVPNFPDIGRFGETIDKHKVSVFYIAPTAIRMLLTDPEVALKSSTRKSLRLLGTVGEPINPDVWRWYRNEFGDGKMHVVDTWWQTETGGQMITPMPNATTPKPGAAMSPFFGIQPQLVDQNSDILEGATSGHLVVLDSWPGQARTIWGDHERFIQTYFTTHEGMYFTGDGAKRDEDNDYWITGRVDDVLNVSGHRLGTAEIESATVAHPNVAEAAVVGFPHDLKGEAIYVYISPTHGTDPDAALTKEVRECIRKELGPIATPDLIQWTHGLPKTRSGKIMRRILRKIAANEFSSLGDTSTLADPGVVQDLIEGRLNR